MAPAASPKEASETGPTVVSISVDTLPDLHFVEATPP